MAVVQDREGGDITAADMVAIEDEPSDIANFFDGSTVFITGATGFLGKMFLEKLLRSCKTIKQIYLLVRTKKGKEINTRFEEIFEGPSFDNLKRSQENFRQKVSLVGGDCSLPDLGLSEDDKNKLISEVDCIFHCAATVRFDAHIKTATYINVRAVRDLIKMAKQMKNLRAMVYVSTAFANCVKKTIDEVFYEPPITGEKLLELVECLDDDKLSAITPTLLGDYPNSYVYTKAVAEDTVKKEGKNLPIGVFRPSIVIASVKEPVAGWIDNLYGATGVLIGAAIGVLRSLHGVKTNVAEMVPADYVVNSAIAAAWDIATMKSLNDNKESPKNDQSREEKFEKEIPVYNFVSSPEKPITWEQFKQLSEKHAPQVPSEHQVWHYVFDLRSSRFAHMMAIFLLHTIPAYIVDFIAICIGKKPMMVEGYKKINKFADVIAYFSMRQWNFSNTNVQALWKRMAKHDKQMFQFSMIDFDWDAYFYTYVRGSRVYLLKDPLETLPKGRVKYYKVMIAHYTLCTFLLFILYQLLSLLYRFMF